MDLLSVSEPTYPHCQIPSLHQNSKLPFQFLWQVGTPFSPSPPPPPFFFEGIAFVSPLMPSLKGQETLPRLGSYSSTSFARSASPLLPRNLTLHRPFTLFSPGSLSSPGSYPSTPSDMSASHFSFSPTRIVLRLSALPSPVPSQAMKLPTSYKPFGRLGSPFVATLRPRGSTQASSWHS
jgi:hypothetical protein